MSHAIDLEGDTEHQFAPQKRKFLRKLEFHSNISIFGAPNMEMTERMEGPSNAALRVQIAGFEELSYTDATIEITRFYDTETQNLAIYRETPGSKHRVCRIACK